MFPRLNAILRAGFVAGTLDIFVSCLLNRINPLVATHAVASGLLGPAAFQGGIATALAGLLLQWAMAFLIAAIYVMAVTVLPLLQRLKIWGGLVYGVIIFFVMNDIVVPLSNAPFKGNAMNAGQFAENMLAMLLFGFIIAWFARTLTPLAGESRTGLTGGAEL